MSDAAATVDLGAEHSGILRVRSAYSGAQTMSRLEAAVHSRGLTVFATIKFSEDASRSGLSMRFTEMLVFGNPAAGTPVMVASPSAALDLPLKVLVAADEDGSVWLSFNDPRYLQQRHRIPPELVKNISGVAALLQAVAQ